jgi:hypothetical protein
MHMQLLENSSAHIAFSTVTAYLLWAFGLAEQAIAYKRDSVLLSRIPDLFD